MTEALDNSPYIAKVCLLAGKIMLQNGAETYRVEDTMTRIAAACDVGAHSFVTPTGILFSIEGGERTNLIRVSERSTDLQKVTRVNWVSRSFCGGHISLEEAYASLKEIESAPHSYPRWLEITAAAVSSGCFLLMFQGKIQDFIPTCFIGGIGFSCFVYFHRVVRIKFFAEFLAALLIGLLSLICVRIGIGHSSDKIVIGAVMSMVPGLLITNAIRDLIAGHLVSGTSKGIEAFLTAFAIGAGIAVSLSIL